MRFVVFAYPRILQVPIVCSGAPPCEESATPKRSVRYVKTKLNSSALAIPCPAARTRDPESSFHPLPPPPATFPPGCWPSSDTSLAQSGEQTTWQTNPAPAPL